MQIHFATKKVDGAYEVALMVDGMFKRSAIGKDVLSLLNKLVGPIITSKEAEGVEIAVSIGILTAAEVAREEARQDRARQTKDAEVEAMEIERLTTALKRERDAVTQAQSAVSGKSEKGAE